MFKTLRLAVLAIFALTAPLAAQEAPADPEALQIIEISEGSTVTLDDFLWIARPLVVFADSEHDPRFIEQMANIEAGSADLAMRDVVVIVDTKPALHSAVRDTLHPRGFAFVLIGKDGQKYLRKPLPWEVREISRSIDKMPMRQQELKEQRATE